MKDKTATESNKTFVVNVSKKEKLECVIREPGFKELTMALSVLRTPDGRLNSAEAGKMLLDLCKINCDKKIEANPALLVSLCLEIANECLDLVETELKKN